MIKLYRLCKTNLSQNICHFDTIWRVRLISKMGPKRNMLNLWLQRALYFRLVGSFACRWHAAYPPLCWKILILTLVGGLVETFHFSSRLLTILSYNWVTRTVTWLRIVIYFSFHYLFIIGWCFIPYKNAAHVYSWWILCCWMTFGTGQYNLMYSLCVLERVTWEGEASCPKSQKSAS